MHSFPESSRKWISLSSNVNTQLIQYNQHHLNLTRQHSIDTIVQLGLGLMTAEAKVYDSYYFHSYQTIRFPPFFLLSFYGHVFKINFTHL